MRFTTLDDAWGEVAETHPQQQSTSAKKTTLQEHVAQDDELPEKQEIQFQKTVSTNVMKQIDNVINEIELLRLEENKRFTIYVIIACILFAMLLWYIDKLNNKITYLMMMQWKQSNAK